MACLRDVTTGPLEDPEWSCPCLYSCITPCMSLGIRPTAAGASTSASSDGAGRTCPTAEVPWRSRPWSGPVTRAAWGWCRGACPPVCSPRPLAPPPERAPDPTEGGARLGVVALHPGHAGLVHPDLRGLAQGTVVGLGPVVLVRGERRFGGGPFGHTQQKGREDDPLGPSSVGLPPAITLAMRNCLGLCP